MLCICKTCLKEASGCLFLNDIMFCYDCGEHEICDIRKTNGSRIIHGKCPECLEKEIAKYKGWRE